jgi:hypothetical protein
MRAGSKLRSAWSEVQPSSPHHRADSEWVKTLRDALGQDVTLLGIAEQTNLMWNGATWRVAGPGDVTIYSREQTAIHHNGDRFTLGVFPQVNVSSAVQ